MVHSSPSQATSRRQLVGLGALVGAGAVLLPGTAAAAPAPAGATSPDPGLPVLPVGADWQQVLAKTPQVQLEPGATYTLSATTELPDGCLIQGNGATVTTAADTFGALRISGRSDVILHGIRFLGRAENPVNSAPVFDHVALRISRSTNVQVHGCDFENWRGAGVVLTGSTADDYFAYRTTVQANRFHRCYFGVSVADRAEYGLLSDNVFTQCRLAIWNSAGNWAVTGNLASVCYAAYYSIASTSPYGSLVQDNWGHGSLVGNTFNHCTSGGSGRWSAHLPFPVGGVTRDPGSGVVVEGLLPPTFSGNTLWYSDVSATNLTGTRWLLSGSTFSNLTIRCLGVAPVHLLGTQSNGVANKPVLVGNVNDLHPWP